MRWCCDTVRYMGVWIGVLGVWRFWMYERILQGVVENLHGGVWWEDFERVDDSLCSAMKSREVNRIVSNCCVPRTGTLVF
jgi:hypothetical protein